MSRSPGVKLAGRLAAAARRRSDATAALLLAAAVAAFFWPLFLPGVWMPEGGGDNAGFLLPLFQAASDALRSGRLPLWNPYLYCGSPMAADVQLGLFYPPNLAMLALVPKITYRWLEALSALHFWWAGLGLYVCARQLRVGGPPIGRAAAVCGALAFGLSDLFVTHFGNANMVAAASWLPWSFVGLHRALHSGSGTAALRWSALGALAVGMAGLAGHPQPLAYILLLLSGYCTWVLAARTVARRHGRADRVAAHAIVAVPLTISLGLGLAAIALVPAWELLSFTRRAALETAAGSEFSLAPGLLAGLFVPTLFGRGMQHYWGPWPRVEAGYLGAVTVAFAAVSVLARLRRDRPAAGVPVWGMTALVLTAFVLALGDRTPAYAWLRQLLPAMEGMRAPARFVLLADFGLALLGSLGVDVLLTLPRERLPSLIVRAAAGAVAVVIALVLPGALQASRLIEVMDVDAGARAQQALLGGVLAVGALCAAACLALWYSRGRISAQAAGAALAVVVLVELSIAGAGLDRVDWDPTANLRPPAMSYLAADSGLYRVEVRPEAWGWWSPGAAMVHQRQDVSGVYNPLQLADYQLYWDSLTDRSARKYDFLNAKYVIAPKDFALPWGKFAPVYDDDEHLAIFLNTAAMPRANWVAQAVRVPDHEAAWAAVQADDFDPSIEVVVEDPGARPSTFGSPSTVRDPSAAGESGRDLAAARTAAVGTATIIHYRDHAVEIVSDAESEGYVVVADAWYPGWRASVDGRDSPVLRANYAFRAVRVPAGEHRVRLDFRPTSVAVGLFVSVLAGVAILGALATAAKRPS